MLPTRPPTNLQYLPLNLYIYIQRAKSVLEPQSVGSRERGFMPPNYNTQLGSSTRLQDQFFSSKHSLIGLCSTGLKKISISIPQGTIVSQINLATN